MNTPTVSQLQLAIATPDMVKDKKSLTYGDNRKVQDYSVHEKAHNTVTHGRTDSRNTRYDKSDNASAANNKKSSAHKVVEVTNTQQPRHKSVLPVLKVNAMQLENAYSG